MWSVFGWLRFCSWQARRPAGPRLHALVQPIRLAFGELETFPRARLS
jgi:hypothetical protein